MRDENDLTLEKLKIHERLASIETLIKEMSVQLKNSESLVMSHIAEDRKMFYGNGGLGLVTRLDRVEQNEKTRQWTLRAVVVAVLGVFVKMVSDLFKN